MRARLPLPLAALLGACSGSSDGGGTAPAGAQNLGVAAEALVGSDDLWLVLVPEPSQGGLDLNGDGDALDLVLFVLDLERQVLLSPGLAVGSAGGRPPLVACDGVAAAFAVDEAAQGGVDLNGDGDAHDRVLSVLDRAHGTATSLARAVRAIEVGGELVACAIDEADDGARDLDLDGDSTGTVLGIHDARDGSFTPFGLRDSKPLAVADGRVALVLAEADGLDLNFDGDDADELVFEVWDGRTRLLQNTALVLATPVVTAVGGIFGVLVSESAQGRGDLSGDGDADDAVFHAHDPERAIWVNLRLSVPLHPAPAVDGERFLLHALEGASDEDWNGDGDLDDLVVHVFEGGPGIVHRTNLASATAAALLDGWVGVSVSEAMQGSSDLDGDGEAGGDVVHVIELSTGIVQSLGIDALELVASETHLFLAPYEDAGGAAPFERRLLAWSAESGAPSASPVGGAVVRVLAAHAEHALVTVADEHGALVLELADARTGERRPLGLPAGRFAHLTPDVWVIALVEEAAIGADRNGDGDLLDDVLHLVPPAR